MDVRRWDDGLINSTLDAVINSGRLTCFCGTLVSSSCFIGLGAFSWLSSQQRVELTGWGAQKKVTSLVQGIPAYRVFAKSVPGDVLSVVSGSIRQEWR